ncbi:MAG: hypothetical protein GTO18_20590 [Anaerolineales bacterium]|nr:hypothetical protein [Anaerolineales bacterium]
MPYLIDGHNLIGSMREIKLDDPDDEALLIELLIDFCKSSRKTATVFFDQRGYGMEKYRKYGRLSVEFITKPGTADSAIASQLKRLGRDAKNYTVVSSDHQVQGAARRAGARIIQSREFASLLSSRDTHLGEEEKPSLETSQDELNEWEKLFREGGNNRENL